MTRVCEKCDGDGGRQWTNQWIVCRNCDGAGFVRISDVELEMEGQVNLFATQ